MSQNEGKSAVQAQPLDPNEEHEMTKFSGRKSMKLASDQVQAPFSNTGK